MSDKDTLQAARKWMQKNFDEEPIELQIGSDSELLAQLLADFADQHNAAVSAELEALKASEGSARKSVRYALATFRALDRYVYQDSDHDLLIKEAVEKLESSEITEG